MSLQVLDPGLATRVVDFGRPHTRHLGVPLGGAADRAALTLANALVGNPPDAPALEVTLKGPIVRADAEMLLALVGAPLVAATGQQRFSPNRSFVLAAGTELYLGGAPAGVRAYLAVPGGFDVPEVLGSRSALALLRAGDLLPCAAERHPARIVGPECPFLVFPRAHVLHVLPGPQHDWFPASELQRCEFQVSPASNRMGLRLTGPGLTVPAREMVSEPVCPGSVQVTRDGQPIVLGVDGQTIGGYPKIAQVIRADLDRLGQMRQGDRVRFEWVDMTTAATLLEKRRQLLAGWVTRIGISLDGP
jgi:antagonist of KipI